MSTQVLPQLELDEMLEHSRLHNQPHARSVLELTNCTVLGGWGLPCGQSMKPIDDIEQFGWSKAHVDMYNIAVLEQKFTDVLVVDEDCVLLSFPGAYTYGHWLIEIPARIAVFRSKFPLKPVKFLIPSPITSWMRLILGALNVDMLSCIELKAQTRLFVRTKLYIPGLGHSSGYFEADPFAHNFSMLRGFNYRNRVPDQGKLANRRLFIAHTPMTSKNHRPVLSNSAQLIEIAKEFGFETFNPAEHSLARQAAVFEAAEVIIGEDSSALHNCIWSHGSSMIVLGSRQRRNMLHAAIGRLIDQKVIYIESDGDRAEGFSIDPAIFKSTLEETCSRHSDGQSVGEP